MRKIDILLDVCTRNVRKIDILLEVCTRNVRKIDILLEVCTRNVRKIDILLTVWVKLLWQLTVGASFYAKFWAILRRFFFFSVLVIDLISALPTPQVHHDSAGCFYYHL